MRRIATGAPTVHARIPVDSASRVADAHGRCTRGGSWRRSQGVTKPAGDIRAYSRLIESEVSVAVFAVAFRGPTGWLPNRLPTASAVAVWLYIEVPACRVSPWRGSKEGRAPAP